LIPRHLKIGMAILITAAVIAGFSLRNMRKSARNGETHITDARHVAPPAVGPTEQVTLYVAYDEPGVLHAQSARIPLPSGRQQRAQELMRALVDMYLDKTSQHPLAAGAEVRDVYIVDPGLAVIDTNAAFADGHRSGILVEELTVASMVQTLSANIPGITRVKILVEGKERDTLAGHADLSRFYDTGTLAGALEQLQSAP